MDDGRSLVFDVEVRKAAKAWIALGVRKSGSSVFANIVSALAKHSGVNAVDVPGAMFEHGYRYADWNGYPRLADLLWRGNAYVGFRDPPTSLFADPVFASARKILLVRDPRDALVSEYFSNAYSHRLPSASSGATVIEEVRAGALASTLEAYVVERAEHLDRTVAGYRPLFRDPNLKIMRYEDVILDKRNWILAIAEHFDWEVGDRLVSDILGWADVRPETEDPHAFVRRVTPGDHRDK
ncbi:MAG TPA: sulfotransferase domain-containing protein, partial [Sphingomonas sp.]